jgi:2-oxoglutarate dehydrogenase E2 component (dihydrolipoamide succinyltransferase)
VTKGDALAALEARATAPAAAPVASPPREIHEREERVKMTRLRQTIARRLKEAQSNAAMLTTFNEVDMTAVMAVRAQYKDAFEKRHGVKLGFMSFFVAAVIHGLKQVPDVNAEIDGTDIIYKNHYDIGVAVGTEKGLVVPVVRDADAMGLADIEKAIGALGKKARDGQLTIEDMQGGTFTISNGGNLRQRGDAADTTGAALAVTGWPLRCWASSMTMARWAARIAPSCQAPTWLRYSPAKWIGPSGWPSRW